MSVARNFVNLVNASSHRSVPFSVNIPSSLLEALGFDYAEKLVFGINLMYPLYYLGVKPYSPWYSRYGSRPIVRGRNRPLYVLETKFYSGDVSGTISEALFAYITINYYGVSRDNFVHLRPLKQ